MSPLWLVVDSDSVTLFFAMPLRFCANLSMMFAEKSVSLIDRYSLAAKAGFKGVECAFPYDFSAEELAKARGDLQQVLINVFPGDSLGFAASTGKEEEFKESLKKSLAYCKALNCKRLRRHSNPLYP